MCDMTDQAFTAAAAAGMAADQPIRTHIIGAGVGANRFTLSSVARFGGSTEALLVDDANLTEALLSALKTITAQPLPCEYMVPAAPRSLARSRIRHGAATPHAGDGPEEEVPYAIRRSGCGTVHGGWYYDSVSSADPSAAKPSRIIMCPCTCASLNVGTVEIYVGCRVGPPVSTEPGVWAVSHDGVRMPGGRKAEWLLGLSLAVTACGGQIDATGPGVAAGGSPSATGTGGLTPVTGGSPAGGATATGGAPTFDAVCSGLPFADSGNCAGKIAELEPSPLDVYLMLDRTQSMQTATQNGSSTRWADLGAALERFVSDPEVLARDIRMGIQFFSVTGGFDGNADCAASSYAAPAVEIGPVAQNGLELVSAARARVPSGETPSVAALEGAVRHAIAWQAENPARQTIVLYVTDGMPTMCDDQTDASLLAAAVAGIANDPPIRTYVVGVSVGANLFRLRDLANVGGPAEPYLVEDADATAGFHAALATITQGVLPCEYQVPGSPDPLIALPYAELRMLYTTPNTSQPLEVPYVTTRDGCSYGGWYYDVPPNVGTPSQIIVCPCTCTSLGAGSSVYAYVGCFPL